MALAKLRMHTDSTLALLESLTAEFGLLMQNFQELTCSHFATTELPRETTARNRRDLNNSTALYLLKVTSAQLTSSIVIQQDPQTTSQCQRQPQHQAVSIKLISEYLGILTSIDNRNGPNRLSGETPLLSFGENTSSPFRRNASSPFKRNASSFERNASSSFKRNASSPSPPSFPFRRTTSHFTGIAFSPFASAFSRPF